MCQLRQPTVFIAVSFALFCGAGISSHCSAAEPRKGVAAVKFSERRGFYDQPFSLEMTTKTSGAKIYFTTNGAPPREGSGFLYTEPVPVNTTTILRAKAFRDGFIASDIETRTYLFLKDVLKQTGAGFPVYWGTNQGKVVPADYEMDPEIVDHPAYREKLIPALQSIPTISLVMKPDDLFGARGLYSNPNEHGDEWERAASLELMFANGDKGFQIDCGLRIQGGWNRRPEESPKHSVRIVFKKKYGPAKLKFPLFGDSGPREFDTLVLRGGCNNTWLHWSGEERRRGDFIRDQWMRDTLAAMGHPSARGFFVHLYLNGLYWGLYNLCERPNAPFLAAHFGGKPADYDTRNGDRILEGDDAAWKKLMTLVNAGVTSQAQFRAIEELLDLPELIDFLIANFYGANADWDRASNWYAGRRRSPPGKYQFFVWDGERTLESVEANSMSFDDDQSPPRLFQKLRENAEFRKLFTQRARLHLTDGGVLTPLRAGERYQKWAREIEKAVVAESARWGDYRRDVHPYKTGPYELYTRDDHWRPEIRRLLEDYFPKRTAVVLRQFQQAGLYAP